MESLLLSILAASLLCGGFVLGGLFGAGVYHFAKKQVEAGAEAVEHAADKSAKAVDSAAAKL